VIPFGDIPPNKNPLRRSNFGLDALDALIDYTISIGSGRSVAQIARNPPVSGKDSGLRPDRYAEQNKLTEQSVGRSLHWKVNFVRFLRLTARGASS
jgi:hypothetical protein